MENSFLGKSKTSSDVEDDCSLFATDNVADGGRVSAHLPDDNGEIIRGGIADTTVFLS